MDIDVVYNGLPLMKKLSRATASRPKSREVGRPRVHPHPPHHPPDDQQVVGLGVAHTHDTVAFAVVHKILNSHIDIQHTNPDS